MTLNEFDASKITSSNLDPSKIEAGLIDPTKITTNGTVSEEQIERYGLDRNRLRPEQIRDDTQ